MNSQANFNDGDDVTPLTGGSRGVIIDTRVTTTGITIYGVRSTNGNVTYHEGRGLRNSAGLGGTTLRLS